MTGVHHFYHYPPTESLWLSCIFKKSHIYLLLFAILRYSLCFLFLYFTMPMTVLRPYILFACPIIPSHDIIFSITGSVYYSFRRVCRYLQTTVKPNIFSVRTPLPPANHTERFLIFFTLLFIKCLPILSNANFLMPLIFWLCSFSMESGSGYTPKSVVIPAL